MYLKRGAVDVLLGLSFYVANVNAASSFKAEILYPQDESLTVYQNDAIIVRYNSEIPDNSLYTWCWDGGKAPTLKARVQDAVAYNGEELVTIDYTSSGSCWFNLKSNENPTDGGYNSGGFKLLHELFLDHILIIGGNLLSIHDYFKLRIELNDQVGKDGGDHARGFPTEHRFVGIDTRDFDLSFYDGLGTAARIGLGVGIAVGVIGIAALAVAFWLLRRRNMVAKRAETDSDSEELQGDMPQHPWRKDVRDTDMYSEELQGDVPKRPWRTDMREMASNEELRRGPQHELPG
ncbi:unnamed protein product [Clonostachys rosea]|uniref:Peptidase A1 domain-containing protein n=1 Tax=Bionectria ochroleuca TaxID=29856 RepID=A0ABY6TYI2_BIOOC|nr:unnamed protein product [Clonostachys rosea]